uniref:Uncharacterized protein n=1 Tax=Chromera velia CCMP2878 TaxID=1169474 RepID=A0A0G4I5T0_9ALVE|eukprot:Cvel_11188.t1-p1 / transcript=Cvel_11188.t1 / gene=Cvel_11188 / organism=Chromera_velia_CCMP2878 / gene_product=hypothetical protein / transcript_product=hypothetical protein / location=Cvel_scaffold694:63040-63669(+) / protein_length=210 / sequence_SO=supercontig / SO=protein_coding / is_pseudo=false
MSSSVRPMAWQKVAVAICAVSVSLLDVGEAAFMGARGAPHRPLADVAPGADYVYEGDLCKTWLLVCEYDEAYKNMKFKKGVTLRDGKVLVTLNFDRTARYGVGKTKRGGVPGIWQLRRGVASPAGKLCVEIDKNPDEVASDTLMFEVSAKKKVVDRGYTGLLRFGEGSIYLRDAGTFIFAGWPKKIGTFRIKLDLPPPKVDMSIRFPWPR